MKVRPLQRHRHGGFDAFTLIELLVVISIIAVLAGLLFPVINKVQKESKVTKTMNNLKTIGTGVFAYAADNNGQVPLLYNPEAGNWIGPFWCSPERIGKYLSPAIPYGGVQDRTDAYGSADQSPSLLSPLLDKSQHNSISDFGANTEVFLAAWGRPSVTPRVLSSIQKPTQLAMVMTAVETSKADGSVKTAGWYAAVWGTYNGDLNLGPSDHGSGRYMFLYADGHVAAMVDTEYKKMSSRSAPVELRKRFADLLLVDPSTHPPPFDSDRSGELGF